MTDIAALTAALDELDRHLVAVQSGNAKGLSNASRARLDILDVRAALAAPDPAPDPVPDPAPAVTFGTSPFGEGGFG